MTTINVWIDDFRKPTEKEEILVFTNAEDAVFYFQSIDDLENVSQINLWLDHDLGEGISGYDFCKWFVEWNLDYKIPVWFHILSNNPVGAANMCQLLSHYGGKEF